MKKSIFILSFVFIFVNMFGQNDYKQNIRGRVTDEVTESPVTGATVILLNSEPIKAVATDYNGDFTIENVDIGRHDIKITFIGYKPIILQNILVKSGKELVLDIKMEESVVELDDVFVKAKIDKSKPINDMANVSARSFTVAETERYAGSMGDPSRMARNFAGVSAAGDSRNDIIIRGNSPLGLLWRLNGVNIPNPNHFGALGTTGGPVSILNNNLLTNSDFFTGAFPAEYGNAISGAFDLQMRNGNRYTREFTGQVGFNGFEVGTEGPFSKKGRASYLINFRYSTMEVMDYIGFDFGNGAIPQYKDLSFKLNFPTKKAGKFEVFGIGGLSYIELLEKERDSTDNTYSTIENTNTYNGSDMGAAGIIHNFHLNKTTHLKTTVSVSGTRLTTTVDSIIAENDETKLFYRENNSQYNYSISSKFNKKFNSKNNINFGFIIDDYNINFVDSFLNYNNFVKGIDIQKQNLILIQGFGGWQHKFSDKLSFYTGVHYQQFNLNNYKVIEPRASIKWNFTKKQSLSFGYGIHNQLQPLFVYFIKTRLDKGTYIETNKDLEFSKSNHYVVGYDYSISRNLRIKTEAYYQDLANIPVEQNPSYFSMLNYGATFHLDRVDSLVNEGTGENYGIELTVEKFFADNYYFLVTGSLFESKYTGSDGVKRNTAFNNNFVFNTLAGYEFEIGKKSLLAFDIKCVYAGGKRQKVIDLNNSIDAQKEIYFENSLYENRYSDYFRFDTRVTFKLNGKNITQEWALDLQNLTNKQNVFNKEFNVNSGKILTKYQQGFFPMMMYRINF